MDGMRFIMTVYQVTLKYEITKAKLLMKTTPAKIEAETEKSGYSIKSHPIKMIVDNTDFFESLNIKGPRRVLEDSAVYAKKAALEAVARYTNDGNAMLDPEKVTVAELAYRRSFPTITAVLDFIPKDKPKIDWADGFLEINYIIGNKRMNFLPPKIEFEYIPYDVAITAEVKEKRLEESA